MQNWEKRGVVLVILTNFGNDMAAGQGGQIMKNACKNTYLQGLFSYLKIKGCGFWSY